NSPPQVCEETAGGLGPARRSLISRKNTAYQPVRTHLRSEARSRRGASRPMWGRGPRRPRSRRATAPGPLRPRRGATTRRTRRSLRQQAQEALVGGLDLEGVAAAARLHEGVEVLLGLLLLALVGVREAALAARVEVLRLLLKRGGVGLDRLVPVALLLVGEAEVIEQVRLLGRILGVELALIEHADRLRQLVPLDVELAEADERLAEVRVEGGRPGPRVGRLLRVVLHRVDLAEALPRLVQALVELHRLLEVGLRQRQVALRVRGAVVPDQRLAVPVVVHGVAARDLDRLAERLRRLLELVQLLARLAEVVPGAVVVRGQGGRLEEVLLGGGVLPLVVVLHPVVHLLDGGVHVAVAAGGRQGEREGDQEAGLLHVARIQKARVAGKRGGLRSAGRL